MRTQVGPLALALAVTLSVALGLARQCRGGGQDGTAHHLGAGLYRVPVENCA